ncbi:MAG: type I DNA topoisomerase [Bacteroidia bacterium]|nr:type I DNA topoisomerase [Bacteroidia bacterium]
MPKNLVIVESPAKAKTIEKYLGKDFKVLSSYGHIRDLEKSENAVKVDNGFKPNYVIPADKKKVVKQLKESVKKSDEVWLATDEDREGEAISWHLCQVLGLDEKTTKRIVFHEITEPAIKKAIENPRNVDLNLVDAQQARRILDRLVGYKLSGTLWKKVKGNLSAGRVQSVAVKLVVEREREILAFDSKFYYKVVAEFQVDGHNNKKAILKAELSERFKTQEDAQDFLKRCIGADFNISNIEVKPAKRRPSAPFTTSTLQQEASRKLGFSVKRTMQNAQRLYESGLITYMRTDSINLSELAIATIADEITKNYGEAYLHSRRYKTKKKDAQEAHEAIRPTYADRKVAGDGRDQQRLYELIWKRTIASQMAEARLEKTLVEITISSDADHLFKAEGEVLKFDGFLKVYMASKDEDEDDSDTKGILPPLLLGQHLDLDHIDATQRFSKPPARYTEASLVKKLEELGIGRPSTYAPTISRIMEEKRGYIVKGDYEGKERNYVILSLRDDQVISKTGTERTGSNKNRLVPTDIGMVVTDFLSKNFQNIMDYSFTANIEEEFDDIANGEIEWHLMLGKFYGPFETVVKETIEKASRSVGERNLGTDPESGRTVLVRLSRFGKPIVQIGTQDELNEDEKPKYANLGPQQTLETIGYDDAMELFKLPREMEAYDDKEVSIGAGRYGPYVKWGETFISIPRNEDPLSISRDRVLELIEIRKEADKPQGEYKGIPYTKGKGRFGPFFKYGDLFVNIPRRFDPETITQAEAAELIEAKIQKEANRYIHNWSDEQITVENGRWGPFIRFKKKNLKIPKVDGEKVTSEKAKEFTLEQVKAFIEAEIPDAFKKKGRAKKKKV